MIKLGAQLFTVRDFIKTEKDFARTIERVAKIGYKSVQISGAGEFNAKEYRKICDAHGIEIGLTHTDQTKVMCDTDKVIEDHQILGCNYIGLGSMPGKYLSPDWIHYFAEDYLPAAEKMKANGMKLMYHNHAFEFFNFMDGKNVLEVLMDDFAPDLLGFTLDSFWVHSSGTDVCDFIAKCEGRLDCVHLKDILPDLGRAVKFAEIGEGNLDFSKIIPAFEKAGSKFMFVEQDDCERHPFDSLKISYDNLSAMGYK